MTKLTAGSEFLVNDPAERKSQPWPAALSDANFDYQSGGNADLSLASLVGTNQGDELAARWDGDIVLGLAGDDVLLSSFNATILDGGPGSDLLDTKLTDDEEDLELSARQVGGGGDDILSATFQDMLLETYSDYYLQACRIEQDGGAGDDHIYATVRAMYHYLHNVDNWVDGGSGHDEIRASIYGDQIIAAQNSINGGSGNDIIEAEVFGYIETTKLAQNNINGGSGNDTIDATAIGAEFSENLIEGGTGDDTIKAHADDDGVDATGLAMNLISGGSGADSIVSSAYAGSQFGAHAGNNVSGGAGADIIEVSANAQFTDYGSTHNIVSGEKGNDTIVANAFVDAVEALAENLLDGGAGDDKLTADISTSAEPHYTRALNRLEGGSGADQLYATATTLNGDVENDLDGGNGDDVLTASAHVLHKPGFQTLSTAQNRLDGGNGDDVLTASARIHTVDPEELPGSAENLLDGGNGDDVLEATIAADSLGRSVLIGGAGDDVLSVHGGSGNVLDGGRGNDTLSCGDGADILVFRKAGSTDTVLGFEAGVDMIQLDGITLRDARALDLDGDGSTDTLLRFSNGSAEFLDVDLTALIETDPDSVFIA